MPRAIAGSSDRSDGTFGPAQGTPSRRDARQLDMQAVTFLSLWRTDNSFEAPLLPTILCCRRPASKSVWDTSKG